MQQASDTEVRDKRTNILAIDPPPPPGSAVPAAQSLRDAAAVHWPALTDEQSTQVHARGITVTGGTIEQVEADIDGLAGVRLAGGSRGTQRCQRRSAQGRRRAWRPVR